MYIISNTVAPLSGAAFTDAITVNGSTPLYAIPNTVALLSGAAFTGAITVNGSTPLYTIPSTVALLAGATFTGAVTTAGLSLGDNSVNFKLGVTPYTLTTTMLKALVDNSTVWKTTDTDLSTCAKLYWCSSILYLVL